MSGRGRRPRNRGHHSNNANDVATSFAADSPVLEMFRSASVKLTERYDRHERLVKLSRDITIESKRIIFQLHSSIVKEDQPKVVKEAMDRLDKLVKGPIKAIGFELENSPAYLHTKAVSPGLQEFIEAKTFCHLMKDDQIISKQSVQNEFMYKDKVENEDERVVVTLLPPTDYMLGLADLTGELMRKVINNISSGDNEGSFKLCQVVRSLYTGFMGLYGGGRELSRKLATSRANTLKAEGAVYAVRVRGGEAPPPLLLARDWDAPAPHAPHHSDDEGYY